LKLLYGILAGALSLLTGIAQAQTWPERPVRWIHTSPPGSSADIVARVLSEPLATRWGRQVIIDNRPGAAGNIAAQAAARAAPDGYNYFFGVASTLAVNPYTFKSVPFDAERDFVGVANLGVSPFMIAVNALVQAKTLAELIALAKAQPGKLAFATSGPRNLPSITGELFKATAGIDMLNVPYKGSPQAVQSLIAGETQVYIDSVPALAPHLAGGRLRVLGVTSPRRIAGFESIPAVAETLPGFAAVGWFALLAPAGTPGEIVLRVNQDLDAVLALPGVAQRMRELGVFEGGGSPQELDRFMREERARWQKVIREAGIEPE
jgi:tripartite-type tricarboxylate transporter receptor subunit TctC